MTTASQSSQCDRVASTFEPWVRWSQDSELLALLALVQRALVARGWQVAIEVSHAPKPRAG